MKRIIILLVVCSLFTPSIYAKSISNAELIQKLLIQIQVLQTELNSLRGVASVPRCTFTRLLYFGVKGEDVVCLQTYLRSQGYFTEVPNGNYGPYTMDAASKWQKANGIIAEPKEYGLWGEQSRALYINKITRSKIAPPAVSNIEEKVIETVVDKEIVPGARPEIIASAPRGDVVATGTVELSITTEDPASCRYGTSSKEYSALPLVLNGDATRFHKATISGLSQKIEYTYYVRCINSYAIESPIKRIRFKLQSEIVERASEVPSEEAELVRNSSFVVFDNVAHNGKPANSFSGFRPIKILYWSNFGVGNDYEEPDETKSRNAAHLVTATSTTNNLVVLDIEHWPMTPEGIPETVRKYNQVADWVKSERPELNIGYYGVPPRRNYNDAVTTSTVRLAPWYATNDSLAGMVSHVDVLFPSLYTFKNDIPAWVRYAKANIAEAKRLAQGKPIYPYIWYKYHNSTPLKDQYIDREFWRVQLETIKDSGVNGVVIWGSEGKSTWDGTAEWWHETKSFVSTMAQSSGSSLPFVQVNDPTPLTSAEKQVTLADLYRQLQELQLEVAKLHE